LNELSILTVSGTLLVVIVLAMVTNLRIIQADIAFKTGDLFARPETWPVSIAVYDRARDLAPSEDYYYLFLGRAYLEYAKTLSDVNERDSLIQQAAQDLKKAQEINPLNTDHTANLGRLYNLWAAATSDTAKRSERALIAEKYFTGAVMLSPHSARLYDEFALLYLNVLNEPEKGYQKIQQALEIDPYYDWSYALLGDYYARFVAGSPGISPQDRQAALEKAAEAYQKAVDMVGSGDLRYNYLLALAGTQAELVQIENAIESYLLALEISPDPTQNWRVEEVLARLFIQIGDFDNALLYAQRALAGAPEDQKARLQELVTQSGG
jgi:tetratricopeptide (TPR) repeat protein